ncbi:MAG: helix-turn-helix domain-containing protein [Kiritimatiellia bacterium]
MNKRSSFASFFDTAEQTHEYWAERSFLDFTENIIEQMNHQNVTRTELARRLGASTPYVTKILKGETNFTLDSMVKLARAVGCELKTHLQPEGVKSHWFDVHATSNKANGAFQTGQDMQREFSHYKKCNSARQMEISHDSLALAS